ncbi:MULTISPECIES: MFS transporter [Candidatus Ichthyocystis]|uniref:Putative transporter, MFS family n=1 Tax=Candidatus Ichthyocystis hellenicum TaxID=1561003 RepID=A0A0S4M213_9BURK|nr:MULTISPECIES: MFS transporter [Ichthyocystis]CUT17801.1 putative transporter, MFS family [Candidatus Ichthyocystis hellenicum]
MLNTESLTKKFPPSILMSILSGFTAFLNLYVAQPFFVELSNSFHVSISSIAFVQSLLLLVLAISSPFVSACNDIYGRDLMLKISFAGLVICQLVTSIATKFWIFAMAQSLLGFFPPAIITAAVIAASKQSSHDASLRGSRLYIISIATGGTVSRLLSGVISDIFGGWRVSYAAIGLITAVFSFIVLVLLVKPDNHSATHLRKNSLKNKVLHVISELGEHLTNTSLLKVYFCGFLLLFSIISVYTINVLRLSHYPFETSATERGALFLANLVGCLVASRAMIILHNRSRSYTFWYYSVFSMILGVFVCWIQSKFFVFLGTFIAVSGCFGVQICSLSSVSMRATRAHSSAVGLYTTSYYLGGFSGSYYMAYMYEHRGVSHCITSLLLVSVILMMLPLSVSSKKKSVDL